MKKKIVTMLLMASICTLSACGGNADTETSTVESEAVLENEDTEEIAEETEETEEIAEETEETEEIAEETEEIIADSEDNEDSTEDNAALESTGESTAENSDSNAAEAEPVHSHSWDSGTVTQAATCTSNGVKTYKCSCGETKSETINATGHDWVTQTTVVHHDAEGMYQQVQTGTQRIFYCNCGEVFYSGADRRAHDPYNDHGYSVWDEPAYETRWIETQAAYDETVTTGYTCSVCGATQ
jgi:hypothetical protein